jgi:hypothetical protein
MKKYKNIKRTFAIKNKWIPFGAECLILKKSANNLIVLLKDVNKVKISRTEFKKYFTPAGKASKKDLYEFESDKNKYNRAEFIDIVRNNYQRRLADLLKLAINKAFVNAYEVPGNQHCLNISQHRDIVSGKYIKHALEENGSPFFNRRVRWSQIARENKWSKRGKPAPIGVRPEDYATLKECNAILKELLRQIFSMDGIPFLPKEILKMIGDVKPGTHRCRYCGKILNIALYKYQLYGSREHALNFCHIDPKKILGRTRKNNIYIGHTKCNRIQGGLSEKARILDGLRILKLHKAAYINTQKIRKEIKKLGEYFSKTAPGLPPKVV